MTILNYLEGVRFSYLKKRLRIRDSDLSGNISKLETAGYVTIWKMFVDKKPHTTYRITENSKKAFRKYIKHLEGIIKSNDR